MIILDTETTGLLHPDASDITKQPYITEFYGIKVTNDFDFVDEIESFVKPPVPIPPEVVNITGITEEMVADAPSFIDLYNDLSNFFLGETIVVAHNAPFDIGVLKWELTRYDLEFHFPWPKRHICTVEGSRHIKNKRLKLRDLHELATGRKHEDGAHRAKQDVMALVRSFKWLVEEGHVRL